MISVLPDITCLLLFSSAFLQGEATATLLSYHTSMFYTHTYKHYSTHLTTPTYTPSLTDFRYCHTSWP